MTVFVTDGDQRPALAIVRTLGRRGLRVIVGEDRPASLASSSKYCVRHITYPSPYRDRSAFEQFADFYSRARGRRHAGHRRDDPLDRATQEWLSAAARSPFAGQRVRLVTGKARLLAYAEGCGVPIKRMS